MMQSAVEKSGRDEAPPVSSTSNLNSLSMVSKQNGLSQVDGQSIMMLQQSQLVSMSGATPASQAELNPETEVDVGYDEIRDRDELREQDRFLPIANVARIMKRAIPETGKIAKDAKECVQECVSEFISFITSEASERCQQEKRKTINGEDILFAMTTLGFDNYVDPLKVYLTKYRESIKGEKLMNVEYTTTEVEDSGMQQHTLQYQVGTALHPSMVSADGTYAYTQAQVSQLQSAGMQFNS